MSAALKFNEEFPKAQIIHDFSKACDGWGVFSVIQKALILNLFSSWNTRDWRPDDLLILASDDAIERASYVIAINALLLKLLPRQESINIWLNTPSDWPPFHGRSAIGVIMDTDINGLKSVLEYLQDQIQVSLR